MIHLKIFYIERAASKYSWGSCLLNVHFERHKEITCSNSWPPKFQKKLISEVFFIFHSNNSSANKRCNRKMMLHNQTCSKIKQKALLFLTQVLFFWTMEISFHLCHLSQLEALTYTSSWQGQDNSAMSWDCICLSGNMQGALLLTEVPGMEMKAGNSPVLLIAPETMEVVSWEGLRCCHCPEHRASTAEHPSALPGSHPLWEPRWAPGCHPQSKALLQTHGFNCLSGF